MLRSWYAVYTRPQKELKVSTLFSKKGIENFCPIVNIVRGKNGNKKTVTEPLFNSFVFVYIHEKDITTIKHIQGVISILYWKSKPAIIKEDEIEALKRLNANYTNIKIERSVVDHSNSLKILDEPQISFNENTVSVKYQLIKINLPSLGYRVTAERVRETKKENSVYQEAGLLSSFPKRINAFFFN